MNRFRYIIGVIVFLLLLSVDGKAQRVAVSTNLLGWGTLSPNFNLELAVSQHNSLSIEAYALPFNINNKFSVSHFTISPEYKYWFTMPFFGHFAGANLLYSTYERVINSKSTVGKMVAAGATYGYSIILGKRWNLVPTVGVGVGINRVNGKNEFLIIPTKVGVNIQMVVR